MSQFYDKPQGGKTGMTGVKNALNWKCLECLKCLKFKVCMARSFYYILELKVFLSFVSAQDEAIIT
jgi:hypothetical protein